MSGTTRDCVFKIILKKVKKTLKNTAKEMGVNVSDINAQLATVRKEIEKTRINDWKAVISKTTYNEVSDAFLDNVEKPKQKNYAQRRAYSKKIYDALKNF
jgi:post-segregation antitoxin (ccd killing protein)